MWRGRKNFPRYEIFVRWLVPRGGQRGGQGRQKVQRRTEQSRTDTIEQHDQPDDYTYWEMFAPPTSAELCVQVYTVLLFVRFFSRSTRREMERGGGHWSMCCCLGRLVEQRD